MSDELSNVNADLKEKEKELTVHDRRHMICHQPIGDVMEELKNDLIDWKHTNHNLATQVDGLVKQVDSLQVHYEEESVWVNYENEVDQLKKQVDKLESQNKLASDLLFEFEKCHQEKENVLARERAIENNFLAKLHYTLTDELQ